MTAAGRQTSTATALIVVLVASPACGRWVGSSGQSMIEKHTSRHLTASEIAGRVPTMRWFPDIAAHRGLKAARVIPVHGLAPGLGDYYLVELTDSAHWYGAGKVSLQGEVLAGAERPIGRAPTETAVLSVLARSGHGAHGQITWVAVNGPPTLGANPPFLPLATVPAVEGAAYVNYRLEVFVSDPEGSITVDTNRGVVRLRRVMLKLD